MQTHTPLLFNRSLTCYHVGTLRGPPSGGSGSKANCFVSRALGVSVPAPSIGRRAAVVTLGPKKKHWSNSKAAALRQRSSLSSSSSSIARCLACSACGRLSALTLGSSCRSRSTSSGAMPTSDSSKAPCKAASFDGAELVVAAKARPAGPSSVALGGAEKLRGSTPRLAPIRIGAPSAPRPEATASERPSSKMIGKNAQLTVSKETLIDWRICCSSS
eukprot:scaffold107070_cov72-Phaeocystis_antarctica.AAC.9